MAEAVFLDPDRPETEAAWQDLWLRAEQRSPFTHLSFVRTAAHATGRKAHLAAVQEGDVLLAGCVLYTRGRGAIAAPAPLTRYTALLLDPLPHERHVLQRTSALDLLLALVGAQFPVAALSLAPELGDVRALQWAGFGCEPRYTYRVAGSYRPSRSVRRRPAELPGYTIESVGAGDGEVNRWLQRHYAERQVSPPVAAVQQAAWLEALEAIGMARCRVLRDGQGTLCAALATLEDDRRVYTWLAGSLPGPALTILQHTLIEGAVDEGRGVDLLGANHASIAFFKAGFGGALTPHFHAVRYRNRALRVAGALRPLA